MYDIIPKTTGSRRPNEVRFEKRGPTAFPLIRPKAGQVTFNSTDITGLDPMKPSLVPHIDHCLNTATATLVTIAK
jgi:hypothetical protein